MVVLVIKNPPDTAGVLRDVVWIPGLGRSLEEVMATHMHKYSCLENEWKEEPRRRAVDNVANNVAHCQT